MKEKTQKKRGAFSWLLELAGSRVWEYLISVAAALAGVACSLVIPDT